MIPPLLKLAFLQGPRDGESLEYKPGSTIRIGRILRGNDLAIKDAGISTKHLRIVSDSVNWIIHDLGSSNGTILNSQTLDPDTPVNLRHGDVIKLGEYTSIAVTFETDVHVEEHKLPPRPRRNNRRLPVADPDPVPVPNESVQEKPTRKGSRSAKQDDHEPPKRSKNLEDIADNEKELDVENEKEVTSRVSRSRKKEKKVAITSEEEAPVEKKGNSRARGGTKNTEDVHNLGFKSIKLENEDTPKGVEMSAMKRATRSRQIRKECLGLEENVKCEDAVLEEKRPSRATRSKKKEIGGDSFLELEMVLNQARKSRAKKKRMEQKPSKSAVQEMETKNDDVEAKKGEKEDETSKKVEQVETESRNSTLEGEEDLNCSVREDGETENLQDTIDEERECKSEEAGVETSDDEEKAEQESMDDKNVDKVEVDLGKMTLGDWFKFMEVHLRKQIVEETEKMIEPMRSKSLRVHQHIAEQKQAKGKASVS